MALESPEEDMEDMSLSEKAIYQYAKKKIKKEDINMLNNVIAMWYIVENPEYKTSHKDPEKEISYAKYRIGVEREYGEKGNRPVDFLACKVFGAAARFAHENFAKGDLVVVEGRMVSEKYGNENEKKYFVGIQVEKNYIARKKQSQDGKARQLDVSEDHAGAFMPDPSTLEPEEPELPDDLPPLP